MLPIHNNDCSSQRATVFSSNTNRDYRAATQTRPSLRYTHMHLTKHASNIIIWSWKRLSNNIKLQFERGQLTDNSVFFPHLIAITINIFDEITISAASLFVSKGNNPMQQRRDAKSICISDIALTWHYIAFAYMFAMHRRYQFRCGAIAFGFLLWPKMNKTYSIWFLTFNPYFR